MKISKQFFLIGIIGILAFTFGYMGVFFLKHLGVVEGISYRVHSFLDKGKTLLHSEDIRDNTKQNEAINGNASETIDGELEEDTSDQMISDEYRELTYEEKIARLDDNDIRRGWVDWQPIEIVKDLGWTRKDIYEGAKEIKNPWFSDWDEDGYADNFSIHSRGVRYARVGKITQGSYKDFDLYVLYSYVTYPAPGTALRIHHALVHGNTEILLLHSSYDKDFYSQIFSEGKNAETRKFDADTSIEELIYPDYIQGRNEREVFIKDPYSVLFFLDASQRVLAFTHSIFGEIYTKEGEGVIHKGTYQDEQARILNKAIKFESGFHVNKPFEMSGGFYFRSPDGVAVPYRQKFDFFEISEGTRGGSFKVMWNDNTENSQEYESRPFGCGSADYNYDVTDSIDLQNDAVVIGKTKQGDLLYGFKNTQHPEFTRLYEEVYYVKKGEEKLSREAFLEKRPAVFWKNTFGRVLAFYSMEFIPAAECGKPVIYLYPEETTNVSVRVYPSSFTKTDPEYGEGWNVVANPEGIITNLVDGKQYPYLFWEGTSDVPYKTSEQGFVVEKNQLRAFLNEKLTLLGLIEKERADFLEFWIPEMENQNKPYYFITFLSKRQIDQLAPLSVFPIPDTIIRVMMDWKGLDEKVAVSEYPNMIPPKRKGFTVVEWGGMLGKQ